jgi:hypothetical protein
MENNSVLEAKIRELEEAYQAAAQSDNGELARMYNRELIHHLLRLADVVRNSRPDNGSTR